MTAMSIIPTFINLMTFHLFKSNLACQVCKWELTYEMIETPLNIMQFTKQQDSKMTIGPRTII